MPSITLHKSKCLSSECLGQSIKLHRLVSAEGPWIEHAAACLWSGVNYFQHITPTLQHLHLLPIFRLNSSCWLPMKLFMTPGPTYATRFHLATTFSAFLPIEWFTPPASITWTFPDAHKPAPALWNSLPIEKWRTPLLSFRTQDGRV